MDKRTQTSMRLKERTLNQLKYLKKEMNQSTAKVLAFVLDDYFKKNPAQDLFLKLNLDNLNNKKKTNVDK